MEPDVTLFRYERPALNKPKTFVKFFRGDLMAAEVQVITEGGENNLHTHTSSDGFWMVVAGEATFYGDGDAVIATLRQHEGIHIPRGFAYWFESSGDGPLELLHVTARLPGLQGSDRTDVGSTKARQGEKEYLDGRVR